MKKRLPRPAAIFLATILGDEDKAKRERKRKEEWLKRNFCPASFITVVEIYHGEKQLEDMFYHIQKLIRRLHSPPFLPTTSTSRAPSDGATIRLAPNRNDGRGWQETSHSGRVLHGNHLSCRRLDDFSITE